MSYNDCMIKVPILYNGSTKGCGKAILGISGFFQE